MVQAQQISPEQLYRQIAAALAQDNARLGLENEQLKQENARLQKQNGNAAEHK